MISYYPKFGLKESDARAFIGNIKQVKNAREFIAIQKEFGSFDKYVWGFVGSKPIVNKWKKMSDLPATSNESDKLSKDLKKRGFKFVGSTIIYAHLQATGLINDHQTDCFRYKQVQK